MDFGTQLGDLLSAKMPKAERPKRRRTNATRNWVFLPMVGRKGFPAAVCQTSMSFESIESIERER